MQQLPGGQGEASPRAPNYVKRPYHLQQGTTAERVAQLEYILFGPEGQADLEYIDPDYRVEGVALEGGLMDRVTELAAELRRLRDG